MSQPAPHIVLRQYLEVSVTGAAPSAQWLDALGRYCQETISQVLTEAFDRQVPAQQHLVLDRLDLEVSVSSLDEQQWRASIEAALSEALTSLNLPTSQASPVGNGSPAWDQRPGEPGTKPTAASAHPSGSVSWSEAAHPWRVMAFFLAEGRLPWWAGMGTWAEVETQLLTQLSADASAAPAPAAAVPAPTAAAIQRTLFQWSPQGLRTLHRAYGLDRSRQAWFPRQVTALPATLIGDSLRERVALVADLWTHWQPKLPAKDLWQALLGGMRSLVGAQALAEWYAALLHQDWWHRPALTDPRRSLREIFRSGDIPGFSARGEAKEAETDGQQASAKAVEDRSARNQAAAKELIRPADSATAGEVHSQEGEHVSLAGLVLLHPYLALFFEQLGLVVAGQFESLRAQQQAIHLLGWLATGERDLSEDQLGVVSRLVGWPDATPLPRYVAWPEAWQSEGEVLLQAVIRNWGALGNSSVAALRDHFLQRPGLLTDTASGEHLLVESQAMDVLLQRLPWGLSPIWLPWRPRLLLVTWT
jgi:hypothetical protein